MISGQHNFTDAVAGLNQPMCVLDVGQWKNLVHNWRHSSRYEKWNNSLTELAHQVRLVLHTPCWSPITNRLAAHFAAELW